MRTHLRLTLITFILLCLLAGISVQAERIGISTISPEKLAFTPNLGQWQTDISYQLSGRSYTSWFTSNGVYHQLTQFNKPVGHNDPTELNVLPTAIPTPAVSCLLKQVFLDANSNPLLLPENKLSSHTNFFLGNDPSRWRTNIPSFESIVYHELYSGISVRYHGNETELVYDLLLSPGADISQVRIRYEGADSLWINQNGQLVVETPLGRLIEKELFVYQSAYIPLQAHYVLFDKTTYGFALPEATNPFLAVTIDPTITFSSYVGGTAFDEIRDLAIGPDGDIYVFGQSGSIDFPMYNGVDTTYNGGFSDVFVSKFSSDGDSLLFSTYIGGSDFEAARQIVLDADTNIYIGGYTASSNYPTQQAFDTTFNGGSFDCIVTKLSPQGDSLVFSTYIGGAFSDGVRSIGLDSNNNVYLGGRTTSPDFPIVNAIDSTFNNLGDLLFVQLAPSGDSIVYSTFIGGTSDDGVIKLFMSQTEDMIYLAGATNSVDFPVQNGFDNSYNGYVEGFLIKISRSGDSIAYSSYLGGSDWDEINDIAVDSVGNVFAVGHCASSNFPTLNAYDNSWNGSFDAYLTKVAANGTSLLFSTYLGGSGDDEAKALDLTSNGKLYLAGYAASANFPTLNGFDTTYNGDSDVFVASMSTNGASLLSSTFIGGAGDDLAHSIYVHPNGTIYAAGYTASSDFPAINAYDASYNDGYDGFLIKFRTDTDNDGIFDDADNCILYANASQADGDSDGVGDICDPCPTIAGPCANCCVGVRGNVNNSGATTIADLVFLAAYLFNNGAPPVCLNEANVNALGGITIADLTYLVSFLFNNGPQPPACP